MGYTSIEIDFTEACMQAKKLEECAENMEHLANQQIADTLKTMATGWKGESANAYFAKADIVKSEIAATAKTLYSIASSIRAQARRTYDAEKEALRLAEQRSFSSGAGEGGGGGGGRGF